MTLDDLGSLTPDSTVLSLNAHSGATIRHSSAWAYGGGVVCNIVSPARSRKYKAPVSHGQYTWDDVSCAMWHQGATVYTGDELLSDEVIYSRIVEKQHGWVQDSTKESWSQRNRKCRAGRIAGMSRPTPAARAPQMGVYPRGPTRQSKRTGKGWRHSTVLSPFSAVPRTLWISAFRESMHSWVLEVCAAQSL